MARLEPGQSIVTEKPLLDIDAGLPVGEYLFQLEVIDQHKNRSKPAELVVRVIEQRRTTLGGTVLTEATRFGTTATRLTNPFGR